MSKSNQTPAGGCSSTRVNSRFAPISSTYQSTTGLFSSKAMLPPRAEFITASILLRPGKIEIGTADSGNVLVSGGVELTDVWSSVQSFRSPTSPLVSVPPAPVRNVVDSETESKAKPDDSAP